MTEKVVLVALRIEADTLKEAKAFVKEHLLTTPWNEVSRVKKIKIIGMPRPKRCRHTHTHDVERENFDWLQGKTRHWRETFCEDCGARVNVTEGYYD